MQKQQIVGYVTKTGANKYRVLASTNAVDRQGDSIDQSGWDLANFKKNPVMPFAHNYDELPVAKVTSIEVTMRGLEAEFEFAPENANPEAVFVKNSYDQGFLNAVSVGFIPKTRNGNVITSAELLEISFVPVPANQEALRLAVKAIDEDATLDEDKKKHLKELFEKGEVADQLTEEQMREQKMENLQDMFEIVYAMCDVYCMPDTPVENFSKLLLETVGILTTLANGGTTEPAETEKAVKYEQFASKAIEAMSEKAGRTISKATMEKIEKACEHIKNGSAVLEELKASVNTQDDSEKTAKVEEVKEVVVEKDKDVIELTSDDVNSLRNALKISDKQNEFVLGLLKGFLEKRNVV